MKQFRTVMYKSVEMPWCLLQFKCPDKKIYDLCNGIIPEGTV